MATECVLGREGSMCDVVRRSRLQLSPQLVRKIGQVHRFGTHGFHREVDVYLLVFEI